MLIEQFKMNAFFARFFQLPKKIEPQSKLQHKIKQEKSFHKSMAFVLVLAQCFGQLPIQGITSPDVQALFFKWKSWRTIYCALICVGASFVSMMQIIKLLTSGMNLFEINNLVFNLCGLAITVLLLDLAKKWPMLMKEWVSVERSMTSYGWPLDLDTRLKVMTVTFMTIAAVEHTLVQTSKLIFAFHCTNTPQKAFEFFFVRMTGSEVFPFVTYALWKGILIQLVNLVLTFCWTFLDLLIMLLSTAMSLRFKQVTARLKSVADVKIQTEHVWRTLREDYNRLCRLCRSLDNVISYIVLLSFASNLFFILIQLFNSLRNMRNDLERVYFFFSFGFLILRTVCVSLYGAWINDESKKPIAILNSVPSFVYNLEIKRFIQQIGFDAVAITGRNFFSVTRGLILSIAGAIVTYELVLIQFNENLLREDAENNSTCSSSTLDSF